MPHATALLLFATLLDFFLFFISSRQVANNRLEKEGL